MSGTGLPEVTDSGQHRRRARGVPAQRFGLGALLVGIAVATVAVPPLITPEKKGRTAAPAAPAPIAQLAPAGTASQPATLPATPAASTPISAPASAPGPKPCAPAATGGIVEVSTRPACGIYTGSLGNGWSVTGNGMKVLPGATVPETKEPALRVERARPAIPASALTITAKQPVGVAAGDRLTLRVWGGREYGTVLKLSAGPAGTGSVTITAPADKWTSYTVKLAELTQGNNLSRIDVTVAADQVPNVNRFFLDDIALVH